jgi:hypothetical protein
LDYLRHGDGSRRRLRLVGCVRLVIESAELVLSAGGSAYPERPADGTLTLVPDNCFDISADSVVHVELDFDAGKSIHTEDDRHRIRPDLYKDVIGSGRPARPLAEPFPAEKLGQRATVVGVVRAFGHRYLALDIPAGQLPPGGCKLWYPE